MKFDLYSRGRRVTVEVEPTGRDLGVAFEGKRFVVRLSSVDPGDSIHATVDGRDMVVVLDEETEAALKLRIGGKPVLLERAQTQLQSRGPVQTGASRSVPEHNALVSPLFGKVISVEVKAGDAVDHGQPLLVLEAMKMESVLRADGKHVVRDVLVKVGEGVNKGQPLLRFE